MSEQWEKVAQQGGGFAAAIGRKRVVITLMVNDQGEGGMQGFAPVAELPWSAWDGISDDRPDVADDAPYAFVADEYDGDELGESKTLTDEQASALLGKPALELVSLGRQRLAQINDEAAAMYE